MESMPFPTFSDGISSSPGIICGPGSFAGMYRAKGGERRRNTRQFDSEDYRTSHALRCCAVQEKWPDWSGDEQEKSNMSVCLEKLQNSTHSGDKWSICWSIEKISSVQSSQLLLQVSAWKIYTGRNRMPTCCKWLLLCSLLWKLSSCLIFNRNPF